MMRAPTSFATPEGYSTPAVNGGTNGVSDPVQAALDNLTKKAQARLRDLSTEHGRDRTASHAASEFQAETLEDLQFARSNYEQDRLQHHGLHIVMAAERRAEHDGRIARAKAANEDAVKAADEANRKAANSREVLNLVRGYANYLARTRWEFRPGTNQQVQVREFDAPTDHEVDASLPEGKTRLDMIATEHGRQADLRADAKRVKAARDGVEEDLAAFERDLDKRAEDDPFKVVFNGSAFVARFPVIAVAAEGNGREVPHAPDYLPGYIRANKKAIMAEARRTIENFYADGDMLILTPEEKRARLRTIADELLTSQRIVAEHIWCSRAEGFPIPFDPKMDPRSILGLDAVSPPKARR
jgi:hypothetical protein